MENVHLAVEEDDIYSGYNDYNPTFDNEKELDKDAGFQEAVRTSHGRRPPSSFDPLGQSRGPAPALEEKREDPEEKIKLLEKKVNDLITESCMAQSTGNSQLALEKAKEAERKERLLVRQREQSGTAEQLNIDLTYAVLLNLANQYENNEMYPEALSSYQLIVKNKMFPNARLKVNMANIWVKQKNYAKAIKLYRMALDHISDEYKEMIKIMQNIGTVFVLLGQYSDAVASFEHIMSKSPNVRTGYNLVLCYYATRDADGMKNAFHKLLAVPLHVHHEDKYITANDDVISDMLMEAIKNDKLHQMERDKARAEKYVMTAAKLIAPAIESSFAAGFDCVEMVKSSQYVELANDLEINKAITYLRQKDFNQAVAILKTFEKKDSRVKSAASTNLSALFFLEKDYEQAERYADLAMIADRYNPGALVNKGNVEFVKRDYAKAAEFFKEALRNDSSCTEALRNLLTYKKLNRLEDALDCFLKLHAILRDSAEVMYQLADYELLEDPHQAVEWLMQVISVVPNDPKALAKLGDLHDLEGDKSQALHYYCESFRLFPCNMEVIEWLAAYYVQTQLYEKAIHYFDRAILVPSEVRWQLMVASCYRRSNYQKALDTYKQIHHKFPENVELRFLVRLSQDMGLQEVQDYASKLKKVEKMKELREQQRVKSTREGSARGRREGSAGSAASYADPLGPLTERPKTGAKVRPDDDDFADDDLGDELLPEINGHPADSTTGGRPFTSSSG
uniref:Intraflagellar transport 88 homolog n=1 Tax=Hippocampus comes TaxID=109280 RepID=A0A3Q2YAE8_HIPCM